uniref:Uncharacterized protein n=1 Tax=Rhizophora mucronata TaxID=61149 RepID=A0A2P2Q5J5_RHIMU
MYAVTLALLFLFKQFDFIKDSTMWLLCPDNYHVCRP